MKDSHFGIIEMVFTALVVIGFAAWQLISINREIAKDKAAKAEQEAAKPLATRTSVSPESPGHPVGEHGLDDR